MSLFHGLIYRMKRGNSLIEFNGKFKFVMLADHVSGNETIADCWIVDIEGNAHPGYNCSAIPVNLGCVNPVPVAQIGGYHE